MKRVADDDWWEEPPEKTISVSTAEHSFNGIDRSIGEPVLGSNFDRKWTLLGKEKLLEALQGIATKNGSEPLAWVECPHCRKKLDIFNVNTTTRCSCGCLVEVDFTIS
jgi:hypothetical protein